MDGNENENENVNVGENVRGAEIRACGFPFLGALFGCVVYIE